MPIAPLLQRLVDDELARSVSLIERTRVGTVQALVDAKGTPLTSVERAHQGLLVDALRRHAEPYVAAFTKTLGTQVRRSLEEQHDDSLPSVRDPFEAFGDIGSLELMDEAQVEADIEISRAMQVIDSIAEWELRELQAFTSTLVGRVHVAPESNPFRPMVYATALWRAACAVVPQHVHRATLLRVSAGVLAALLKSEWAAACTRLEAQGVEPGVYRTVVLAPGSTPGRVPAAATADMRGGAPSALFDALAGRSASLPEHIPRAPQDFEQGLRRLDRLLRQIAEPAADRLAAASLLMRLAEERSALAASVGGTDARVIDLVSRLFETVLSDPLLQPLFRPVFARLHVSALRIALRDASMLDSLTHPVWQWMDRLAEASSAYQQAGDPRAAALLAFGHAAAEELAQSLAPDASLYRRAVARLDMFLAEQLQQQLDAARPATEALARTERRDTLERQLSQRLADELGTQPVSAGVRRFIVEAWARVIAQAMLRFGEDAEVTRGYTRAAEDLIWSVRPPDHPQSRQRLVALLPELLRQLRSGMATIDLPQPEQQALLDELIRIHTDAMRGVMRPGVAPVAEPTSAEIVQDMRDEIGPYAIETRPFADSVIDLASMQTVPAELLEVTAKTLPLSREVDSMAAGRRYRLFLHGRWSRAQLLWRSPEGKLFLFAGETPNGNHSVTRRALERLEEAGLVKPQEDAALMQRSVDSLRRRLAVPR